MEISQELLKALEKGETATAQRLVRDIENMDPQKLARQVNSQDEILAFWINLYNGLAQYKLTQKPSLFKSRSDFFSAEIFEVAGKRLSLDDIEHGILRKGMNKYSKGYIKNIFRDDWFKQFEAKKIDWRIHFALNCAAASCPPIRIYEPGSVYKQLNENAREYLKRHVRYDKEKQVVQVPKVMDWYSGDFGGSEGVRDILRKNGYIPMDTQVSLRYNDYDWSLDLGSFKTE